MTRELSVTPERIPTQWVFTAILFLLVFLFAGCGMDSVPIQAGDEDLANDRVAITNNEAALESFVQYADEDVPVDSSGISSLRLGKATAIKLRLRAQVVPPSSDGQTLQATHVALSGDYAYVSYNMRGETYLGAIDVFNVSNKRRPRLISRAVFQGTDVSAVYENSGRLYLAEATSDTGFASPAVVEEIELKDGKPTLNSRRTDVSSYVATDVKVASGNVFVTSGSGGVGTGGLTVLDQGTFSIIATDEFLDARAVSIYSSWMTVLSGTPATLRLYNLSTGSFVRSYYVGGANIPESKSTAEVVLSRAFVAAGDEGLKVVNLLNDTVIDSIPAPVVSGLDPSLTVTNAVSVNKDLVFMANGEAGVYVASADFNLETTWSGNPDLKLEGKMIFGTQESANYIASKSDLIFIATGLGGLKIVEVQ
ncbi:MAG: hypothetical protein HRF44_03865 [Ignavibacterium sp.]